MEDYNRLIFTILASFIFLMGMGFGILVGLFIATLF